MIFTFLNIVLYYMFFWFSIYHTYIDLKPYETENDGNRINNIGIYLILEESLIEKIISNKKYNINSNKNNHLKISFSNDRKAILLLIKKQGIKDPGHNLIVNTFPFFTIQFHFKIWFQSTM